MTTQEADPDHAGTAGPTAISDLVRAPGDRTEPVLIGGRCQCGFVFFPMQRYGCERCGSTEDLAEFEMAARGQLIVVTTVRLPVPNAPPPPFLIAMVRLDDGPTIFTFARDVASPGQRVQGIVSGADRNVSGGFAFTADKESKQ